MATITVSDNTGATVGGVDDNELTGFNQTAQLGTNTQAYIDAWSGPDVYVTLVMRFPIPSGSGTVSNSKLRLYMNQKGGPKTALECYEVLRNDWVEAQATYNIYKTSNNWTTGGAQGVGTDRGSTVLATVDIASISVNNYIEFTGSGLTALIQNAVTNALTEISLVVQFADLTFLSQNYVRFVTSEGTDGQRPELVYDLAGGGSSYNVSSAESASISENISSAATFPRSVAEIVTAVDSPSAGLFRVGVVAESLSADSTQNSSRLTSSTQAETASIIHAQNSVLSALSTITESASVSSTQSSLLSALVSQVETMSITQLQTVEDGSISASRSESNSVTDSTNALMVAVNSASESLSINSLQSSLMILNASGLETSTANESSSSGLVSTIDASVSDSLSITETYVSSVFKKLAERIASAGNLIKRAIGSNLIERE